MSATAQGLTSQAGLLPVVKYLSRIGFEKIINRNVPVNQLCEIDDWKMFTLIGVKYWTLFNKLVHYKAYTAYKKN